MFPALPAALDWVLETLERHGRVTASVTRSSQPWRTVRIVRVRDKEVLLVAGRYTGEGRARKQVPDVAAVRAVAGLLPARGYHQVVPGSATPLMTLRPLLPSRVLNCLAREGFTSVEQVAVLPDAALHDLPSLGTIGIGELHDLIATMAGAGLPGPPGRRHRGGDDVPDGSDGGPETGDGGPAPARGPAPDTPLEVLGEMITSRTLNLLLRHGYRTVGQVAAAPDVELLEVRHLGAPSVASVRDAIAALHAVAYPVDATVVFAGERVRELVTLLSTLAVYADAAGRPEVAQRTRVFLEETVPPGLRPGT